MIVLDGDGSLLMNLGSLVTIAGAAPADLTHFVCDNGCYEANGSHPLPGGERFSLPALAAGAGIADVSAFEEFGPFEAAVPGLLTRPGPVFGMLMMVPGEASPQDYDFNHGRATRERFRRALAG